jgi:hypothetical protein
MKFPYIFHRYIHLFPNGERATMDVWIHPTEVIHPSTLKGKPTDPKLQGEFDAWQKFAFQNVNKTKSRPPSGGAIGVAEVCQSERQ